MSPTLENLVHPALAMTMSRPPSLSTVSSPAEHFLQRLLHPVTDDISPFGLIGSVAMFHTPKMIHVVMEN
jgi:hypothetical protein